jgi:hypothetical protein
MSFVNVYLRGSDVIIVPAAGRGGVYTDIAPVLVVPPDPHAVHTAIVEAREVASRTAAAERPKKWVVQEHLRLKSIRSFYVDVAAVRVYDDEQGRIVVSGWRPAADGRGFEPDGTEVIADADAMGRTALALLKGALRFPK